MSFSGPCIKNVRTKSSWARSGACFLCRFDPTRAVSPTSAPVWSIHTESQGAAGEKRVRFGNHRISSLLFFPSFPDDEVLLVSSGHDLQRPLGWFAVKCEAAEIGVSSFKSKVMVLNWKKLEGSFWAMLKKNHLLLSLNC